MLVAWSIVLSRLSGEDSFVIGIDIFDEKGLSIDALPVHVDLTGEPNAFQLLERVKNAFAVAGVHRVHPSDKVDGTTIPSQEKAPHRIQVSVYTHNEGFAQPSADYVAVQGDLELHLSRDNEDAAVSIRYATAIYSRHTIERHTGYLQAVLANMVANGGLPIASFDIMSPAEKTLLLETWNETAAEYPADRCIHHLFEDQVDKSPDAVAIVHGERALTYLELNAIADRFACQLLGARVRHGDLVAFLFQRSVELVAIQLAVLKVGATYVPIDPKVPVSRQAFIVRDSAAVLLATDAKTEIPSALDLPVLFFGMSDGVGM